MSENKTEGIRHFTKKKHLDANSRSAQVARLTTTDEFA